LQCSHLRVRRQGTIFKNVNNQSEILSIPQNINCELSLYPSTIKSKYSENFMQNIICVQSSFSICGGLVLEPLFKICACSSVFYKMVFLHTMYTYPPVYFESSLDY
jgi:hypothetical protein